MATAAEIADRLRAEIAGAVKAITLEVTANLIEDCPVDTRHCRANFVPAIGAPWAGESIPPEDGADPDTAAQEAGMAAVLDYQLGAGDVHVTNNVPYLAYLLLGSSAQAPAGWDLQAISRAQATIQAQYAGLQVDLTNGGTSISVAPRGKP